jgi:hypothetical protein
MEEEIKQVKELRLQIQKTHDQASGMNKSRAMALAITKLDEASMWLGKRLQELNTPNPYPTSRDPSNSTIDPTAPEATRL